MMRTSLSYLLVFSMLAVAACEGDDDDGDDGGEIDAAGQPDGPGGPIDADVPDTAVPMIDADMSECQDPDECPAPVNECETATCDMGTCGTAPLPLGTLLS